MEAQAAREILLLPEIVPLEATPDYVAGVINLRGQAVPIIDLELRFGHPKRRRRVEDCVVILERAGSVMGVIVNEVQNARDIAPDEIAPIPSYGTAPPPEARFLTGLLLSDEQVVMLLDLDNLLRLAPVPQERRDEESPVTTLPPDAFDFDATPQEQAVFRERARTLAQLPESGEQAGTPPLAVARLGEEFFGIDLQAIREFTEMRSVTPVPCCPNHIVGQMNLRGDLITLIDISEALGLAPIRERANCKVVVVNSADLSAGVLVEEVLDVLSLPAANAPPVSTAPHAPGREYLRGTAPYGARMLHLLDLPALLRQESLLVNEKP